MAAWKVRFVCEVVPMSTNVIPLSERMNRATANEVSHVGECSLGEKFPITLYDGTVIYKHQITDAVHRTSRELDVTNGWAQLFDELRREG